jgi:hypothetical protein
MNSFFVTAESIVSRLPPLLTGPAMLKLPETALHVCAALSVIAWLMVWLSAS